MMNSLISNTSDESLEKVNLKSYFSALQHTIFDLSIRVNQEYYEKTNSDDLNISGSKMLHMCSKNGIFFYTPVVDHEEFYRKSVRISRQKRN